MRTIQVKSARSNLPRCAEILRRLRLLRMTKLNNPPQSPLRKGEECILTLLLLPLHPCPGLQPVPELAGLSLDLVILGFRERNMAAQGVEVRGKFFKFTPKTPYIR